MDKKIVYWFIIGFGTMTAIISLSLLVIPIQMEAYNKWISNCDNDFGKDSWYVIQGDCKLSCKNLCIEMNCYENYEKVSCSQFKQDYDDWEHYCDITSINEKYIAKCSVQGTMTSEEWFYSLRYLNETT